MEQIKWKEGLRDEELTKYTMSAIITSETHLGVKKSKESVEKMKKSLKGKSYNKKYTDEYLTSVAKKYKSLKEFREKEKNAYNRAFKRGKEFLNKICKHMHRNKRVSNSYTIQELINRASKFKTRGDFAKGDTAAYIKACKMKVLDKVCKHMKKIYVDDWNEISLKKVIKNKNIKSRTNFIKVLPTAYKAAWRLKLLDKLFPKKK
jgi:hypothetical protein